MSTTSATFPAALPPAPPMSVDRLVGAYWAEARYEILRALRTPMYFIPTVILPLMLYLFFGIVLPGARAAANPDIPLLILSGFAMFAVIGPGMFGLGIGFAMERQFGIVTLKRALPMPPAANLVAKLCSSMVLSLIVVLLLIGMAVQFGHAKLTLGQGVGFAVTGVLGALPFCALGLLMGTYVSGTAAPGVVNLVYFPMIYLSGLFPFPLPKALQAAAQIWPAFHLNQIALASLGLKTAASVQVALGVLVAFTVVCVVLATRRLARVG